MTPKSKFLQKRLIHRPIKVGDYYSDCGYIPRICVGSGENVTGRSLIDGSIGHCSERHCGPTWMHKQIAKRWAKTGPISKALKEHLIDFYESDWGCGRKVWWE